ncbi:MAG: site-specific integrase, partial [Patescibacteria group bacterium]
MRQYIVLDQLDDFLLYLKTQNYSNETLYNYERDLRQLENYLADEKIAFDKIDKQTILRFKAYLTSRDR